MAMNSSEYGSNTHAVFFGALKTPFGTARPNRSEATGSSRGAALSCGPQATHGSPFRGQKFQTLFLYSARRAVPVSPTGSLCGSPEVQGVTWKCRLCSSRTALNSRLSVLFPILHMARDPFANVGGDK